MGEEERDTWWRWWAGGCGPVAVVDMVAMDELQRFHTVDFFSFIFFLVQWMEAEDNSLLGYLLYHRDCHL